MNLKQAALRSVFGIVAVVALGSAALADETNQNSGQSQQNMTMVQRPMGQLLWLKPSAGQPTCPEGTALAVTTNAAGQQTSKPKCMPKPQNTSSDGSADADNR